MKLYLTSEQHVMKDKWKSPSEKASKQALHALEKQTGRRAAGCGWGVLQNCSLILRSQRQDLNTEAEHRRDYVPSSL